MKVTSIFRPNKKLLSGFATTLAFIIIAIAVILRGNTASSLSEEGQLGTKDVSDNYMVTRVIDGDTIEVRKDNALHKVRLIGIDAPETGSGNTTKECFADEATAALTLLINGKEVVLRDDPTQDDKDRYNRLLRYIFLPDGTNINLEMVKNGYAHEYTYRVPYEFQATFSDAQEYAEFAQVGLWASDNCKR
ncbi:MAG: thermonuclease family protein [Candidatus Dojkabacteria bacterium]|nr:MAG: thermonuclease family protein [Candidatus Dojkabacteria bacterium]